MKKLHVISLEKMLLLCGFSLTLTVLGFWHQQQSIKSIDRVKEVQMGVSTCFTRITQSFTAVMIKDLKSPYINRNFMGMSNECLNEVMKRGKNNGTVSEKTQKLVADLNSEVFWFHEKITKVLAPFIANPKAEYNVQSISLKYENIENLKLEIMDQIDSSSQKFGYILNRDESIVIFSFILFFTSIVLLASREVNLSRNRRAVEKAALSLLNIGDNQVANKVEELIAKTLHFSDMPITQQVFKDFYSHNAIPKIVAPVKTNANKIPERTYKPELNPKFIIEQWAIHNDKNHYQINLSPSEIKADSDFIEQILLNVSKFFESKTKSKNMIMAIKGEESDGEYKLSFFAPDLLINVTDLNYLSEKALVGTDVSLNIVLVKELCMENKIQFNLINKANEHGKMIGCEMSFQLPMIYVEAQQTKVLKEIFKGTKKQWGSAKKYAPDAPQV